MARNGGKQRTVLQKAHHRAVIAERYLIKKESQSSIAKSLGISQQQVCLDLQWLREEWLESASKDMSYSIVEQWAKLDLMETIFWDAWEASKRDRTDMLTETFEQAAKAAAEAGAPKAFIRKRARLQKQGSDG